MTEIFKGLFIAVCGLVPAGALYFLLSFGEVNPDADVMYGSVENVEMLQDISTVPELTEAQIEERGSDILSFSVVDIEAPIQAIRVRDTLGMYSLSEAASITGLSPMSITHAIVGHQPVEGYLFEYAMEGMVRVLTPPDTSIFPNILDAEVILGVPKELITLSLSTHKTVDGTKFEYAK